eukprot:gene9142-12345_t
MKGMDVSKKNTKQQPQPVTYTCPMHPEIHATKPGSCPKCGMRLVREKPKQVKQPVQKHNEMQMTKDTTKQATYTCPMHPEIHAAKPGNCPKCGMKLVKEKKTDTSPTNEHQNHGNMQMPMKDTSKSMGNMDAMDMPKTNIAPIKTITSNIPPHTVRYDLYIADTTVTFGKKSKRAIAVNGQIPMPTLTFTEGDTAEIWVHNNLDEETSLHWHGLFLPNQYDGVPNLTQMPIKAHTSHLYKFPIIQHGTHWYHSHTGLQEQIGMYGMFIMNKRSEWDIPTMPMVL